MIPAGFDYTAPESLQDAISRLADGGGDTIAPDAGALHVLTYRAFLGALKVRDTVEVAVDVRMPTG